MVSAFKIVNKLREWLSSPSSGDWDGEGKVFCYGATLSYPFLSPSVEVLGRLLWYETRGQLRRFGGLYTMSRV